MTRQAITGIGRLLPIGTKPGETGAITGPWVVVVEEGAVAEVRAGPLRRGDPDAVWDVREALVTPGLVDPHTHLIYAGDRSDEAAARSRGDAYTGGGILRTVEATSTAEDAALVQSTRQRLAMAADLGTTTIELKSGYGLTADKEARLLRLLGEAAEGLALRTRRTYLGAHAVPLGSTPSEHAQHVIAAIPEMARNADYIDVFCEPTLFNLEDTRGIAEAGAAHGLRLKLHADQIERSGASLLGIELGALSVDHLEQSTEADARAIASTQTVATILPGPALALRNGPPPVRALLDAGATVAIGSDANAGTFAVPSMALAIGLAVGLGMSIDEAFWAATEGAARSLALGGTAGSLGPGRSADIVAWDAEHEGAFALRLGAVRVMERWFRGETR